MVPAHRGLLDEIGADWDGLDVTASIQLMRRSVKHLSTLHGTIAP
jgi:hypothetical protein